MKKIILLIAVISSTVLGISLAQQSPNNTPGISNEQRQSAIASVVIEDHKYQKDVFDIVYPYLQGMKNQVAQDKMNQEIGKMIESFISDNSNQDTREAVVRYDVQHLSPELISFTVTRYTYTGGAHGASFREGYTYDLNTGVRYDFSDIYEYDSSARADINNQIIAQIKERDIPTFGPFSGVSDKPFFYIGKNGQPTLFFQQYEIGPYSVGILEFPVTAKRIK